MTIARTGAKSYSAWLVSGEGPAHGEFVRQPGGGLEASMDGCDLWTATTDWDVYLFNSGLQEDPFVDGVYQFSLPGIELTYKRMPMEFPAP